MNTPDIPRRVLVAATLLLALHALLAVASLRQKSTVFDEVTHLPAGLAQVATGEVRLNPQHPPLVKLLAGLAANTLEPTLPLEDPSYTEPREWDFGRLVLYERGNDPMALLRRARLPTVGLSVLGGVFVFLWSLRRWGASAAMCSLTLYACSPTVLAHARWVTMDAAVATGCVATLYLWWRQRSLACGVALGLTLAAKFSGLMLLPAMALAELAATGPRKEWPRRIRDWAIVLAAASVVLMIVYFDVAGPLRYGQGLMQLYGDLNPEYSFYLLGEFSREGWPYYFLVALLVKTTLPGLFAMVGGLARMGRNTWRDDIYLWLPALLWFVVTSWQAANWGVRYVQPLYPLLFVLAGGLAAWMLSHGRELRLLFMLMLVAHASEALLAYPDYLPYFNQIAGGSRGGIHWLDGSNLDWGQDLARLPAWMESHDLEQVRLLYFGTGIPAAFGVAVDPDFTPTDWSGAPRPGAYVISAEYLVRGLYQAESRDWRSDWLRRYEPVDVLGGTLYLYRFDDPPPNP